MSEQKTHAELIADLRHWGNKHRGYIRPDGFGGYESVNIGPDYKLLAIADSLEAAHKREVSIAEDSSVVGDMEKLSEAIGNIKGLARTIYSTSEKGSSHEDLAEKIVELANDLAY